MTNLEKAIRHIKTRADAWAVKEIEKVLLENEELSKDLDEALEEIDRYERGLTQKSGKWIDIDEQKPDVGISVLVCDDEEDIYLTHITRDGVFFDELGNKIKGIVAWMPLPKPYEPQESEE